MSEFTTKPFQLIASLREVYLALPFYRKIFFPRGLAAALNQYNPNQLETANNVLLELSENHWSYQPRFLLSLNIIQEFRAHQICPWLVSKLVNLAALPVGATAVDFFYNTKIGLGSDNGIHIILSKMFGELPESVTSVNLGSNQLDKIVGIKLAEAFASLHQSVTSVDLSDNHFFNNSGAELALTFNALPQNLASIDLSKNNFGIIIRKVARAFAALPKSLASINLSNNNLSTQAADNLARAFAALPQGLVSINLSENNFAGAELATALAGLPKSVTSVNLSANRFSDKTGTELATALAGLPKGVTSVNLSLNRLDKLAGDELAIAFAGLPENVTSIDLSRNALGDKTGAELAIALKGIPRSVPSIDLSHNKLGDKTGAELAMAFKGIPQSVTSIDLSHNALDKLSLEDLTALENTLPYIKTVCLSSSEINQMTFEKCRALIKIFPGIQNIEEHMRYKDEKNCDISRTDKHILLRTQGVVPSLKMTCAFFVHKAIKEGDSTQEIASLPDAVADYLKLW